jgi:exopolyphosphatase/guanosine-5'-triphosphate,3'-diphosphate pyrophosphatase
VFAAIDVGTNTVRLLLGKIAGDRIIGERYERTITRLGGGFTPQKGLAPDAMERTLRTLTHYAAITAEACARKVAVFGTAALRQAQNADELQARFFRATGLTLEIISGEKEAFLSCRGVRSGLNPTPEECLIFDIGGGSTEFILYCQGKIRFQNSYALGVVNLSEHFNDPERLAARIDEVLSRLAGDLSQSGWDPEALRDAQLVGTAGTVTTLAAVHLGLPVYDRHLVNNLLLSRSDLSVLRQRLENIPLPEREALPGMERGRGDLILPGLTIVEALMGRTGHDVLKISDNGLLEGILLSLADDESDREDVLPG